MISRSFESLVQGVSEACTRPCPQGTVVLCGTVGPLTWQWWECQRGGGVLREQPGAWSGLVLRWREREGGVRPGLRRLGGPA